MEDLFSTFSANQLLMIRPTVTLWHSLHTSYNANDEPLAKIASWRVTLFYLDHGQYRNVKGKNSYTYSLTFGHYVNVFVSIHFYYSADERMRMFGMFFYATRYIHQHSLWKKQCYALIVELKKARQHRPILLCPLSPFACTG